MKSDCITAANLQPNVDKFQHTDSIIHVHNTSNSKSYDGMKKKYRTNEEEETQKSKRERSHRMKQSVPRARQRSECVAE